MPFDGSGNYTRTFPAGGWQGDAAASIKIKADRHDQHDNDLASALSNVLCKDGQSSPTADIKMNGKKIVNLAAGVSGTDAVNLAQMQGLNTFTNGIIVPGVDNKGTITFSGTQTPPPDANSRPLGLRFTQADLFFGVKPAGDPVGEVHRWVWNDNGLGTGSDVMTLTDTGLLTVKSPNAGANFIATDEGSGSSPNISLYRQSDSPAADDSLGTVRWYGRNSAGVDVNYGVIWGIIRKTTSGSENGQLFIRTIVNGGSRNHIVMDENGCVITALVSASPTFTGTLDAATLTVSGTSTFSGAITFPSSTCTSWLAATNGFTASAGNFVGSQTSAILGTASGGSGSVILRPVAYNSATNQTVIDANGDMVVNGMVTAAGTVKSSRVFNSTTNIAELSNGVAGDVYLRPNGLGSVTGQTRLFANGNLSVSGNVLATDGLFSSEVIAGPTTNAASNANTGVVVLPAGYIFSKRSGTTNQSHIQFFNNLTANVGNINTSGSATTYNTSSDEALKDDITPYSAETAIDIIRADPPQSWVWKESGDTGVGWVAQTSHSVHPDLATHIPATAGDKSTDTEAQPEWWGIDYGKRTPYLWAALIGALDKIDELAAKVAALEGTPA